MAERTEIFVPADYAEAMSQIADQVIRGGVAMDRRVLRGLQGKLSRIANEGGGHISLTPQECREYEYLQRFAVRSVDDDTSWLPVDEQSLWRRHNIKPSESSRWRPGDKVIEVLE